MAADVEPTNATGTLMVNRREHSQVWAPSTSGLATTSCPRSQIEKVTLRRSELGIRLSRVSILRIQQLLVFFSDLLDSEWPWGDIKDDGSDRCNGQVGWVDYGELQLITHSLVAEV